MGRHFSRIKRTGFTGHYICGFGTLDDMLAGRPWLAAAAGDAVAG